MCFFLLFRIDYRRRTTRRRGRGRGRGGRRLFKFVKFRTVHLLVVTTVKINEIEVGIRDRVRSSGSNDDRGRDDRSNLVIMSKCVDQDHCFNQYRPIVDRSTDRGDQA